MNPCPELAAVVSSPAAIARKTSAAALASALAFAVAGTAAAQSAAPRAQPPAPRVQPPAPARTPDAEARARLPRERVLAATAWTGIASAPDLLAAIVERPSPGRGAPPERRLVVFRRGAPGAPNAEQGYVLPSELAPTGFALADLTGDNQPELVIVGRAPSANTSSAAAFEYNTQANVPVYLYAASAALDGCASEADVRARAPLTSGLAPEQVGPLSDRALVGRLRFASPAQLRALVAPAGLEVCDVQAPQEGRRTQRCRRLRGARLSDAVITRDVRSRLDGAAGANTAVDFTCAAQEGHPHCETERYQGETYTIDFAGAGADRRLTRLTHIDAMLGE